MPTVSLVSSEKKRCLELIEHIRNPECIPNMTKSQVISIAAAQLPGPIENIIRELDRLEKFEAKYLERMLPDANS